MTASGGSAWWQVALQPPMELLDAVEAWFWTQGALSVTCLPAANAADVLEPDPGRTPICPATQLQVLFAGAESAANLRARLAGAWAAAGLPGVHTQADHWDVDALTDEDWRSRWRQHVRTRCFGGRLWVQTRDAPPPVSGVAVLLDPGLAFGTGSHPTTALCLEWLATHLAPGARVVDFGCGSGILAIAAAKLGADVVYALDHDPQALRATVENAGVNAVTHVVRVPAGGTLPAGCCDVLLANILAGTLIDLAPELQRLLVPGGALVLSGVLAHQAAAVRDAYPEFVFAADQVSEDWVCISGRRRQHTQ